MRPGASILLFPEIHDFLRLKLAPHLRMTFAALLLDRRYRLITHNASVVLFARSDPDGAGEVTESDRMQLQRLRELMSALEVRLLDYIVVGNMARSVGRSVVQGGGQDSFRQPMIKSSSHAG
jgi:DNA repair protein RadC